MKIAVKKKYIVGLTLIIGGITGWMIFSDIWKRISQESISILIIPIIFLISIVYVIHFYTSLRSQEKLAEEVGEETSPDDLQKAQAVKEHLFNKTYNEAYTLNVTMKGIKFTSNWAKQSQLEKNNTSQKKESKDSETDRLNEQKEWAKPQREQLLKAAKEVIKNPPETI